jgi:glycosyltransferase involved in cell wall biosynthesis
VGFEQEVREAGFDVRLLEGKGLVAKARSLRSLIKEMRPNLVYTSLFDADMVGRMACIGIDVPLMSNLANTAYDPARLDDPNVDARKLRVVKMVDGFTARHLTDHFHAVSQAVKDSTVDTMRVKPDRITVVKRGRDENRLGHAGPERRRAVRMRLGLVEDADVVVTVGRQEYQKGHRHLVAAFAKVAAERPQAVLLIAGRHGHASAALEAQIAGLGLGGVVKLLGHRSDVADVLAASDLFVFPSVYEGLGGALIEALALSLPVVVSDIPALREVVVEGQNALLVPPGDDAQLASAILELLSDPEQMHRYGLRSREVFEAEFRAEMAAKRMLELLATTAK